MDHTFTLSRRDFPTISLDIRYTSLDLQDFNFTFISTIFFVNISIMLIDIYWNVIALFFLHFYF